MRLYLSSYRVGNQPDELLGLLPGHKRVGLVANAGDGYTDVAHAAVSIQRDIHELDGLGLEVEQVDLCDYFGKPAVLEERLSSLDLLYVRGGNTFVLRRAFRQGGADEVVKELLARDAIAYAGYSAGVCLLAPSLRGLELVDEPDVVPAGYDAEVLWDGLGLLPYHVVPHYDSDHPESDSMKLLVKHWLDNHVPFMALRDGEAIVIDGERHDVAGSP